MSSRSINPSHSPFPALSRTSTRGFTIVELLVSISVLALLLALLLPSIGRSRDVARSATCLSNLRQVAILIHAYANNYDGLTPALGAPWSEPPFWALSVQLAAQESAGAENASYQSDSILVCPSACSFYGRDMQRTYAINATGHSGQPGDRQNYDLELAHVRFHQLTSPATVPMCVDSAIAPIEGVAPPSTRTSSVIDFRLQDHVRDRLGFFHGSDDRFHAVHGDSSAAAYSKVPTAWTKKLP